MKKLIKCIILIVIGMAPIAVLAQGNPNIFTFKFGKAEVSLLSEGQDSGNSTSLVGATSEMIKKCLPNGTFLRSYNAFLVRVSGKIILVDTGYGRNLFDNLKSLDVAPEKIDVILLTHVHGDHIGGLINKEGKAAFPNATVYISKVEYDYITNGDPKNESIRKVIETYRSSRLRIFQPAEIDENPTELFPGIQAFSAYGHTPGHTIFMVVSENEKFLLWGDITQAMAIQIPYPEVGVSDWNLGASVAARKKALEYVAVNNIPVGGSHIAYPGMGRVVKTLEGGYVFEPVAR